MIDFQPLLEYEDDCSSFLTLLQSLHFYYRGMQKTSNGSFLLFNQNKPLLIFLYHFVASQMCNPEIATINKYNHY